MKNFKRILSLILALLMIVSCAACTSKPQPQPEPIPIPDPVPDPQPVPQPQPDDPSADLKLSLEEWPVVDGALAMIPYYEEMAARILELPIEEARQHVFYSNTIDAYRKLADGEVDIIFCAPPSEEQAGYAKEQGVEFESVQVLNSGFVFFVNKNNPVNSLTEKQVHDIYAGKITNWKEVGGNDEPIIAYQRGAGSGSQSGLIQHVISEDDLMEAPTEQIIAPMEGIIDAVASYDNAAGAIGFTYYYYLTNMHYREAVKMIAIDGVYPTAETITSDLYPFISKTAAFFNADQPEDSAVRKIAAWCAGSAGTKLAQDLGYVPSGEHFEFAGYGDVTPSHEPYIALRVNNIKTTSEIIDVDLDIPYENVSVNTIVVSGLKDQEIQAKINDAIRAQVESLTDFSYIPQYRNISYTENDTLTYGEIFTWVPGNYGNVLSVIVAYSIYGHDGDEYKYAEENFPMNFDLNTGELLSVTDLFASEKLALDYLDSCMYKNIARRGKYDESEDWYWAWGDDSTLLLAAPFRGVRRDQKFYIDQNGDINLVFGSESPEFYTSGHSTVVRIPSASMSLLDRKFIKENIFEDEVSKFILLSADLGGKEISERDGWIELEDLGTSYTVSISLNDAMTDVQMSVRDGFDEKIDEEIRLLYDDVELAKEGNPDDMTVYAGAWIMYNAFGKYLTVTESYSRMIDAKVGDDWIIVGNHRKDLYHSYEIGSDEELLLVDIFEDGVDYKTVLMDAMKKTLSDNEIDINDQGVKGLVESAVVSTRSFGIGYDNLSLQIEDIDSIIEKYLPWELYQNYYKYRCIEQLTYEDIGCENLCIFK